MSAKSTEGPVTGDYGREVRDTIVKSGLTGVAATMLAVTIFSPAGFGGMIGVVLLIAAGVALFYYGMARLMLMMLARRGKQQ